MFSSWIFTFCLCWTLVHGGLHLIGSSQPIVAAPGDDVILPCRVDPEWNAVGKTVEWSRPDLRPSGPQKRVEYVFSTGRGKYVILDEKRSSTLYCELKLIF
ncbi:myelin-oligodendrocyte glycoprotein-like [Poecilia reticulata]|uniref:myelin-oligodendrocyte glycoprotein-like n=1 Tax=Poecilia reticulata TaxID=8081 RepID=UPI0007E9B060|nr:PREDICTED: myelin-oligodendrocyte glycoprotein-like [Poecilia reticulata]